MRAALERVDQINVLVSRRIAFAGVLAILGIAFVVILDILTRLLPFVGSFHGLNEYVEMVLSVAVAATFPAAIALRAHLRINILGGIQEKTKAWLNVLGSALLFWMFVLLAWRVGIAAAVVQESQRSTAIHEIPHYPFFFVISALLCICSVSQLIVFIVDAARADIDYDDESGATAGTYGEGGHGHRNAMAANKDAAAAYTHARPLSYRTPLFVGLTLVASLLIALSFQTFVDIATDSVKAAPIFLAVAMIVIKLALLLVFIPVAAVSAILAITGIALVLGVPQALTVFATEATDFLTNPDVSVLPLFLIMGILASAAGIADDVYRLAQALFGHMKGGLALATIGGCAGFGAVTGSSIATVATIGKVSLPQMQQRGYSTQFSTGSIAAGGTLGALVPPSGALVVYAFLTEQSLGQLFMAAMIPAFIAITFYMITISVYVRMTPSSVPSQERFSWREAIAAARRSVAVFTLFGLVMGGIFFGWFTVAEAASVGAVYAFLIALYRGRLKGADFWQVMGEAASLTAMIYALIMGGIGLAFFFRITGLPEFLAEVVGGMNVAPIAVIAVMMVVYIFLGAIMESFAIMIITVPIVSGLILDLNYDLIWWGIIMLVVLEIGMISPPIGMNVFVLQSLVGKDVPLMTIYKGVMPFLTADIIKLALLIVFPSIILFLPSIMF